MKKITFAVTFFIIGYSLCAEQKIKQGSLVKEYYASSHRLFENYDFTEATFQRAIRDSNDQHFRDLITVADPAIIPSLQDMKKWSDNAEATIEQAIEKNPLMDYRRQEDGQVILQESTMHPEDPVAIAGCITCLGSTVATYLISGPLSFIPVFLMGGSVQFALYSWNKRSGDAQELAQLRVGKENQENIKRDLVEMLKQEREQEEWDRVLAQDDVQKSDTSASMDEAN